MSEVRVSIEIDAPPGEVFTAAMEPDRTPDWVTIVLRVEGHDDGELREGYKMRQRLCLRGVPFTVEWELTELDAPRFARWEGKGPARSKAITENRLEPHGDGTCFTYTNEFKTPFGPLGRVAAGAIMGGLPEREATASLQALKQLVEKGST
ncbi:MAG: SRPBCC family protein [Solirubrobacterales bacterium]|nr:SRPBCC family protein [Solirubrobacterales bacterium]